MSVLLVQGTALHIPLKDASVHCVVTSPPYYGLRDYQTATWDGGNPTCDHAQELPRFNGPKQTQAQVSGHASKAEAHRRLSCPHCGAVRMDQQLGLEAVSDCGAWARGKAPCSACYICGMRRVFAEVWRVLRDDGVMFLNLGDSYISNPAKGGSGTPNGRNGHGEGYGRGKRQHGNRSQRYRLRDDLTPEQQAYVLSELAKARRISAATQEGR